MSTTLNILTGQVAVALYKYDRNTTPWHQASEETRKKYEERGLVAIRAYEDGAARLDTAESRFPGLGREATEDIIRAHGAVG